MPRFGRNNILDRILVTTGTRQRAVRGELTPEEIAEVPGIFHPLLTHLQSPVSSLTTGAPNPTCENWPLFVRHQSGANKTRLSF